MTNQEAINMLKSKMDGHTDTSYEWAETVRMAIKALEQEPGGDLISKDAVLDLVADYDLSMGQVVRGIHALPSVKQEPKTGHWEQYGYPWDDKFKCSECGEEQPKILCGEQIIGHWSDYCPNCGAKMVEPKESESDV